MENFKWSALLGDVRTTFSDDKCWALVSTPSFPKYPRQNSAKVSVHEYKVEALSYTKY